MLINEDGKKLFRKNLAKLKYKTQQARTLSKRNNINDKNTLAIKTITVPGSWYINARIVAYAGITSVEEPLQ